MEPVVEPGLDSVDLLAGDEIDLVEDEHVGEGNLAELQLHHLRRSEYLFGIDDTRDAVQPDAVSHALVHEGERDARRLGHSAGLEQDVLGLVVPAQHLHHRSDQIIADVAADTAVGEADDVPFALHPDDEVGVDVDRAEVVHQDGDTKAVIAGEDAVQQRRLACTEEPCQHREWNSLGDGSVRRWPRLSGCTSECDVASH